MEKMKRFQELSKEPIEQVEKNISKYWNEIDILKSAIENREGKESYIFFEGPPTANGKPGIHHVISRSLKDSVCRLKTMQGYQVKRKAGWDTHGLPVEIEVEKQLGLKNKQEIEDYGIDKFNKRCRESVFSYENQWREMTKLMAYDIDLDNPYITLDNNYVESVWHILDKFHKENYIYEGHKILPYCTRCGTGLASHEVAQGYKNIKSNTVFVKFKLKEKNEYFLVWTTTPWTLAANVALTVNPNEIYVKVNCKDEILYLEKNLASKVLDDEYKVIEEFKGKDLENIEYEQLMPFVKADKKAFYVTLADYVTTEDGTGIVHSAPAFGEDDYNTGKKYGLPVLQPVNEDGKYITTPWEGMFVLDADLEIIKWLFNEGKLYKKQKMEHNYPHCWRCSTPLLYYAKPSWYIEITRLKNKLIENNNSVEWYPDFVGKKRFGNWLENLNDWAISRSRYWGTPLNIWKCECGNLESVGSRKELVEKAIENIDESIELHKPYVDDVHFKCDKCGKVMTRVKDVIDCWFDSGSMPFAQHYYPFENKENFDKMFPADFICEGIDQTRGWFYSLLAISTFMTGKSPYKRVLVNDLILDKDAQKMSKSKGNTVDPFELFKKYGADAVRWYLFYVSPAWTPTKFDISGLGEIQNKFFGTFKNMYGFFSLYANTDSINPSEYSIDFEKRPELDQWLISKFNNLVKYVTETMNEYDHCKTVRKIQEFVNEDMSNWYIRRSRRRFWSTESSMDKQSAYLTTYEVLVDLCKLCAPFAPFVSEDIFTKLTGEKSVHLCDYPLVDESKIKLKTEERMDLVRALVGHGRSARESVKIKVRQPISKVLIDGKYKELIHDLVPLIKEELNVKDVEFKEELSDYMDFMLTPNFKVAGPKFGPKIKKFKETLAKLDSDSALKLDSGDTLKLKLDDEEFEITKELVNIKIAAKKGFTVSMEDNLFVILDTKLTDDLINEGYAREFISKIQQIRKTNNYEVMDNIKIFVDADDVVKKAINLFDNYIKEETLAIEINETDNSNYEKYNINDYNVGIKLERV
jgi:isoleucyl-tRNA synthetase